MHHLPQITCECIAQGNPLLTLAPPSTHATPCQVLLYLDIVWMCVFIIEAALKIVAYGFAFNGSKSYLRDGWWVVWGCRRAVGRLLRGACGQPGVGGRVADRVRVERESGHTQAQRSSSLQSKGCALLATFTTPCVSGVAHSAAPTVMLPAAVRPDVPLPRRNALDFAIVLSSITTLVLQFVSGERLQWTQ